MYTRYTAVFCLILLAASSAWADIPGPGPRPPRPNPHLAEVEEMLRKQQKAPSLVIVHDRQATRGELILPAKLLASLKPAESPRLAIAFPGAIVGLALVGSLIAGGLWLARMPRAKYLLGATLPVLAFAIVAATLHAEPAPVAVPGAVIERGKVRISRDSTATSVRLILPNRVAPK